LVADLAKSSQLAKVEKRLASKVKSVEVLINNAGFRINKSFLDSARDAEQELLDVLVTAPMRLTHSVLPIMEGDVIPEQLFNVSSVASWIAGGTYSAAKSYLIFLPNHFILNYEAPEFGYFQRYVPDLRTSFINAAE
jgi:short-subunit dehydrogenase